MQSELLQTMTARYIPREDRIALDCVIHDGRELRLMFTHRFARAVVAEFARQLSDGGRGAHWRKTLRNSRPSPGSQTPSPWKA